VPGSLLAALRSEASGSGTRAL